eukprot:COSAG06_NODE_690_length_13054_cov_5.226476_1_plen_83_part_10
MEYILIYKYYIVVYYILFFIDTVCYILTYLFISYNIYFIYTVCYSKLLLSIVALLPLTHQKKTEKEGRNNIEWLNSFVPRFSC